MSDKLLRHIPSGVIYISQPAFEVRPDFEPYDPDAALAPDETVEAAPKTKAQLRAEAKAAATAAALAEAARLAEENPTPPADNALAADIDEALSADASRGL